MTRTWTHIWPKYIQVVMLVACQCIAYRYAYWGWALGHWGCAPFLVVVLAEGGTYWVSVLPHTWLWGCWETFAASRISAGLSASYPGFFLQTLQFRCSAISRIHCLLLFDLNSAIVLSTPCPYSKLKLHFHRFSYNCLKLRLLHLSFSLWGQAVRLWKFSPIIPWHPKPIS